MKIAIDSPYTQYSKNFKNGGLLCKHIYFENNFYILFSIHILLNDEYNCIVSTYKIIRIMSSILPFNLQVIQYFIYRFMFINISIWFVLSIIDVSNYKFATDQIIRKTILNCVLKIHAPYIAFSMPIKYLSYLHFLHYFIYRSNMSDYYQTSEPMDIEGEAVCAVSPQLVTAEGEQGAGVDDKRIFSSEIPFSTWVKAFRTSCGYELPRPMGGAKRTRSTNTGPRPMKQRC